MIIATSTPKKWKIFAELIKWYQKTPYSHVFILHDSLVYQASHTSVNCWYVDVFNDANNVISTYEIPDEMVDLEYVKKQLGKGYGAGQIFELAATVITGIKFKGNGDKKFICSELIGKALRLPWVDDFTTPEQIDVYLKSIQGKK